MTQSATVTVDAKASAHSAAAPAAAKPAAAPAARPAAEASPGIDWRELIGQRIIPPILGFALFIAVWAAVAQVTKGIPGPSSTFVAAVKLFSDPFYIAGPNDVGIGWKILNSLSRVGLGFGLAALVGIPAGFLLGRFMFLNRMLSPVIGLLRPVSPLAWLPIGLLVFKAAQPAAIWVIFISSIWPIILNTAAGVSTVPQDYLNVARVLKLSEWKVFTTILFPSVLPHLMTGIRLSIGVAWLVIGLLVFKAAQPAAIWVIFISSIWPIILNTAAGVSTVPQDYLNVARVLKLSEWKVFTTILFPSVLPHLMTGIRLSIGVAWLVIVAAEMLTGGVGLGFWVWDEWNNLNVEHIIVAIFVVGLIGLALEQGLMMLARRFQYN